MCEVLPVLPESSPSPEDGDGSRLEQLVVTMLEERDKLMEQLRESQESYSTATRKLADVEDDNAILMRQLQAFMPEEEDRLLALLDEARSTGGVVDASPEEIKKWPVTKRFAQLARELAAVRESMGECEEEVMELKSERNNTRLLLEHLECLVSRHERSLRMTVMKRQQNTGVSSEVEVLKALKSLFDHHKALDEKVRERLRSAQERNIILEDELMLANQEVKSLQDEAKRLQRMLRNRNSVRLSMCYDNIALTKEQLALLEEKDSAISDLQFSLDERDAQLDEVMHLRDELAEKVQEVEEELAMAVQEVQKDQISLKTASKQAAELSSTCSELESSLAEMTAQLAEATQVKETLRAENQRLSDQLCARDTMLGKVEEEAVGMRAEIEQRESLLAQAHGTAEELRRQNEALDQAEEKRGSALSLNKELQVLLEAKQLELVAAREKEKANEGHIARLQSTIERMLKESNERMKTHSTERKALASEKAVYQEKSESQEKELQTLRHQHRHMTEQLKQSKVESQGETSSKPAGVHSSPPTKVRYSWQFTDLDAAIARHQVSNTSQTDGPSLVNGAPSVPPEAGVSRRPGAGREGREEEGGEGGKGAEERGEGEGADTDADAEVWQLGEPEAVSKLMSLLEGQVSKLDKQLEHMGGESLSEVNKFDQVLQSASEPYSAMEPLPLSSPPGSRAGTRSFFLEAHPHSSVYHRISAAGGSEEPGSPSSSSSSNDSTGGKGLGPKGAERRSSFSKLFRRKRSGDSYKKNAARRASAPIPQSPRHEGVPAVMRESVDFSDFLKSSEDTEEERSRKSDLLSEVLAEGVPFASWDSTMVLAWLEVWVGVPFWYIAAIRPIIHSGTVLASLTDVELSHELGITNTLHRLKLKLAVQEIVALTSNQLGRTTSLYGEMSHDWIADYWLTSLGLSQYADVFKLCLVDARMLEHLMKKDLRTALKMVDTTHRNSLQYGITVLRKLDYSRNELERRRDAVNIDTKRDVLVWTNEHLMLWVESIGLADHASHLRETGVHGGVVALDTDFDYEKLALALQISVSSVELRRQLRMEFVNLLAEGTNRVTSESQSHGKIVRKLSKKLKVGSRRMVPTTEFMPIRATSPVLYSAQSVPPRLHSVEEADEAGSQQNTPTNSVDLLHSPTELTV